MKVANYVQKCVTITKEQEAFLAEEKDFKLSKFLQSKLQEYLNFRKEYKQFMKDEETT